jgi:hypothetical protein
MVAGMRNAVSGGNELDTLVCCFLYVLPQERLSACLCLGKAECGELSLLCFRIRMSSVTTDRVCVFVLFYAGSTFVCVGHANSTQQEHLRSMKLISKWILCYSYRAFPYIP